MLRLPDGELLMHGESEYDPVKAREYYLRTRELKGRKKGVEELPVGRRTPSSPKSSVGKNRRTQGSGSVNVTYNGMTYALSPKQLAEQKAYAGMRVGKIKEKIHKLESALREKMAEARKREQDAKKPKSAAEKREQAKSAEKYRDRNQQKIKNQAKKGSGSNSSTKTNLDTVEGLRTAITSAKRNLSKAVERQRALATASRG